MSRELARVIERILFGTVCRLVAQVNGKIWPNSLENCGKLCLTSGVGFFFGTLEDRDAFVARHH